MVTDQRAVELIDPRGPRFNQAVLALALVAGVATDVRAVVPVWAGVLATGAVFGPRYGPFLQIFRIVIRPRLDPPRELEDPRPPRFAASVGVVFLVAATASFLVGQPVVAWSLAMVVAALAGLAAITGLCVGCEMYVAIARARGRGELVGLSR